MVPPRTHDWRLYIKPHELAFLLQSHGFLVDTSHFRGMMPTLDPRQLLRGPPGGWIAQMHEPRLPPPPLSDFVETASLEVNYMGWAVKSKAAAASQNLAPGSVGHVVPVAVIARKTCFAAGRKNCF